jgi:superoxide dismutase, Cu-Zn family
VRTARLAIVVSLVAAAGCARMTQPSSPPITATAELKNAQGQGVGYATLSQVPDGVRVLIEARGLPPGPHGVHIHAVGKCDPPQFTSAGGHFNPEGKQHGFENPAGPHAGDLPNITIAADGTGRLESLNRDVRLDGGPHTLFDADGSAVVVHAGPDDFKTDPAGNSGARIACGVITKAP